MSKGIIARGIEKSFGDRRILRGCDLHVRAGERIGLVGANGCGKSTLLRIMSGRMDADFGEVERPGTIGLLDQEPNLPGVTVGDAADDALQWHRDLLQAYEDALGEGDMDKAADLQARIESHGWTVDHRIDMLLDRLDAPPRDRLVSELSGGEQRRVALARTLLGAPDVLLLDEPTNHLDSDTAEWLQRTLEQSTSTVILVTHDRYLLEAVATRIVEVEDGLCVSYDGSYGDYLVSRAERRARMERAEDSRLAFLAREAEWASRSPAARTTKQKARLQRLDALAKTRPIKKEETFELDLSTGTKTGRTLMEIRDLNKGYDGRTLIGDLNLSLGPKERVGILGPNGCGKSTLLRMISGVEHPDAGSVTLASRVKIAVLDQARSGLDPTDTVFEAAGNGASHVTLGEKQIHVAGFLRRFLFPREVLDQRVSALSGGERARLLLARLLLLGCNMLLLDEPTNDLDLQTLRVLEEALLVFDGSVVVVTHDRAFLDRVCTTVLAFEGDGEVVQYGSRLQHLKALQRRRDQARRDKKAAAKPAKQATAAPAPPKEPVQKLSFNERKELGALPAQIESLETEQSQLEGQLADPALYRDRADDVPGLTRRLNALPKKLARLYARWEALEAREE
ncbi:MAG: ABC-F family ATP-binding cassette domain-containing protein [Deltaproteobacteria bacterium]|nr:ABC-F family ATP-binding cassette domain-containing protein [Deltaproteobacteria bacterium]